MNVIRSIGLFAAAGLAEIGGGYLIWRWLREGASWPVGLAGAIILVGYIVFVLIGANAQNDIVRTDADWWSFFATWFKDLFNTSSSKWNTVLNYGLAALAYLFVGRLLASMVERV